MLFLNINFFNCSELSVFSQDGVDDTSQSAPVESIPAESSNSEITAVYMCCVKGIVDFFVRLHLFAVAFILGTILAETWDAFKAGLVYPLGWTKEFTLHNLNPKEITSEQAQKRPILLIHGNYGNQSNWIELAKYFEQEGIGPVYTVNLPSGDITEEDDRIMKEKIDEIIAQYKQHNVNDVKIDLIGHSRGSPVAKRVAWQRITASKIYWSNQSEHFQNIGKVITIGYPISSESIELADENYKDRLYEMTGEYDILLDTPQSSCLPHHRASLKVGHLGLLHSSEAHQQIVKWLNSDHSDS